MIAKALLIFAAFLALCCAFAYGFLRLMGWIALKVFGVSNGE